jgi:hypothetical protein
LIILKTSVLDGKIRIPGIVLQVFIDLIHLVWTLFIVSLEFGFN